MLRTAGKYDTTNDNDSDDKFHMIMVINISKLFEIDISRIGKMLDMSV
jgi:hypothetical protein